MELDVLKMLLDPVQAAVTEVRNRLNSIVDRTHEDRDEIIAKIGKLEGQVALLVAELKKSNIEIKNVTGDEISNTGSGNVGTHGSEVDNG